MCGFFGSLALFTPTDHTLATVPLTHATFSPRQTTPTDRPLDSLAILDPTDHTPPTILLTHSPYLTRQTKPADRPLDPLALFAPTDHTRRQTTPRRQFS